MLHKGFLGAEKGVFLAPQTLRSKKFRLRRSLSILRANAAKKRVNFTMQKKRNQENL